MFTCDDRRGQMLPEFRRSPFGVGVAAMALVLLLACSSNDPAGTGAGGSSAPGGHAGGPEAIPEAAGQVPPEGVGSPATLVAAVAA